MVGMSLFSDARLSDTLYRCIVAGAKVEFQFWEEFKHEQESNQSR